MPPISSSALHRLPQENDAERVSGKHFFLTTERAKALTMAHCSKINPRHFEFPGPKKEFAFMEQVPKTPILAHHPDHLAVLFDFLWL